MTRATATPKAPPVASAPSASSASSKVGVDTAQSLVQDILGKHISNAQKLAQLQDLSSQHTFTVAAKKRVDGAISTLEAKVHEGGAKANGPSPAKAKPSSTRHYEISADDFAAIRQTAQSSVLRADTQIQQALVGTFNSVLAALDQGEQPPLDILSGTVTKFLSEPHQLDTFRAAMPVLGELTRLSLPDERVGGRLMAFAEAHGGVPGARLMGSVLAGLNSRRGFLHTVTGVALEAAKMASRVAEVAAKETPFAGAAMMARQALDIVDARGAMRMGQAVKRLVTSLRQSPNGVDIALGAANLVASVVGNVPRLHWVDTQVSGLIQAYDGVRTEQAHKRAEAEQAAEQEPVNWNAAPAAPAASAAKASAPEATSEELPVPAPVEKHEPQPHAVVFREPTPNAPAESTAAAKPPPSAVVFREP